MYRFHLTQGKHTPIDFQTLHCETAIPSAPPPRSLQIRLFSILSISFSPNLRGAAYIPPTACRPPEQSSKFVGDEVSVAYELEGNRDEGTGGI